MCSDQCGDWQSLLAQRLCEYESVYCPLTLVLVACGVLLASHDYGLTVMEYHALQLDFPEG